MEVVEYIPLGVIHKFHGGGGGGGVASEGSYHLLLAVIVYIYIYIHIAMECVLWEDCVENWPCYNDTVLSFSVD